MKLFQILLVQIFCFLSLISGAQSWSIFRGNQQLTGATTASVPDKTQTADFISDR